MNSQSFRFSKNPITFWCVSLPTYLWAIISGETNRLYHIFSIPELIRTFFAPWKRDEVSTENLSLQDRFQIIAGNIATRIIAFFIRGATILVGLIAMAAFSVLGVGLIIFQVLLPVWAVVIIILGVR